MDSSGKGVSGCEYRGDGLLGCSSLGNFTPLPSDEVLGMTVGSEHWNGLHSSFSGGWTPLDSVAHNVEVTTSATSSHGLVDNFSYTDKFLAELEHDIPCFGSGTFPDMDSLVILQRCRWIANSGSSANHPTEESGKNEKALTPQCAGNYSQSQEKCKILDGGTTKPSPDGKKRRRACNDLSQSAQLKNMKTENNQWTGEQDEEKQNPEIKPVAKTCSQIASKEVKDSSSSGDPPKEDYVHVRAKRGQATNSHSLAERVRRERIRERMKFLQDLVPGCDKITGKAVMLDEIINYVLSLQHQVEFLSMKLVTVHPESNVERKQIVHRDIHHSRRGSAATLGDPGLSSYPNETLQRALLDTHGQTANSESSPMPNVGSRHYIFDGSSVSQAT